MERGQCSQAKPDQSDNKQQQHSGGGAGRKEIIGAKRPNRIVRSVLYFTQCLLVTSRDREDAAALLGDGGARQGRPGRQQVDGHGEAKVMHF